MNEHGLTIEGPVEEFSVPARAVAPADLPNDLRCVLLAVKAQDTQSRCCDDRAAARRRTASSSRFRTASTSPSSPRPSGEERTVGAFVNFGADYVGPGRIFVGGRGAFYVGELDGRRSERVERLAGDIRRRGGDRRTSSATSGRRRRTARCSSRRPSRISRSPTRSRSRATGRSSCGSRDEVLAAATASPGDVRRLRPRRSRRLDRAARRVQPPLGQDALRASTATSPSASERPRRGDARRRRRAVLRRTLALIHEIEDGRRVCEVANLELLAAYAAARDRGPAAQRGDHDAPAGRACRSTGRCTAIPVAIKDNIDVRGVVTTNASTVGVPPPAERDAPVVARLRAAGAELLCKTNLLEYAAGSVNPAYGMTFNPLDPSRTSGGSSSGSAALVAAGVCDFALGTDTGGSIRIPAAYCGIVGLKPTFGLVPVEGVFPLSPTCDHVGTLTRTVEQTATLLGVLAGRAGSTSRPVDGLRVGVLRRQLEDPDVRPGVRRSRRGGDRAPRRARASSSSTSTCPSSSSPTRRSAPSSSRRPRTCTATCSSARGTATVRARARCSRRCEGRRRPHTRAALADQGAGRGRLRARLRRGRCARRADGRVSGAAGGSAGRDARGRRRGTLHRPVQPRRGARPSRVPCGIAEGDLPAGLQLAAAAGEDDAAALGRRLRTRGCRDEGRRTATGCSSRSTCEHDDRIVLPLGSVEQHAYLSLAVDQILSERVAVEAAEPLGVPVLPALPYGIDAVLRRVPGQPDALRVETYGAVLRDLLDVAATARASAASCS